jgi:hypothetical protein
VSVQGNKRLTLPALRGDTMRKSADHPGLTEAERCARWQRSIELYDEEIATGEDQRVALMLYGKGVALKKMRRPAEALGLFDEVILSTSTAGCCAYSLRMSSGRR